MVKCSEMTEMSTDYLEGQLPLALRMDVYLHLSLCQPCRRYVGQVKTTVKMLRQLSVDRAPGRMIHEVLDRYRRTRVARSALQREAGTLRLVHSRLNEG